MTVCNDAQCNVACLINPTIQLPLGHIASTSGVQCLDIDITVVMCCTI